MGKKGDNQDHGKEDWRENQTEPTILLCLSKLSDIWRVSYKYVTQ